MSTATDYVPGDYDLRWAKELLRIMKHGGVFCDPDPRVLMAYRIDYIAKTLTLVGAERLLDGFAAGCHAKCRILFGLVGYRVLPEMC